MSGVERFGAESHFGGRTEAAAMDMSAGFAAATAQEAPQVVMVHDKFHVAKMLNEAVDRMRRREHKELLKQNDQRLTGSRQLWLYNPINLKDERAEEFERLISKRAKNLADMDVERKLRRRPLHAEQPAAIVLAAALQVGLTSGIIPEIPVRQPVVVLYGALHSILHADNRDWSPKSRYGCDLLGDSIR
jgi:transposase